MGYKTQEIGPLMATSKEAVPISGVCAVFAESEVINHLSQGRAPADIMHGAIVSLVDRAVQLLKRVRMEPEITVIGGVMRFETMGQVVRQYLKTTVNVPETHLVQHCQIQRAVRFRRVQPRVIEQQRLPSLLEISHAAAFVTMRSGCTTPVTAMPYLSSLSITVCPPTTATPAAMARSWPPWRSSPNPSGGSFSG
jgi:hypothetical protein